MALRSIRIMVQIDWPEGTTTRFWDGAGPFVDGDGLVWKGASMPGDLDEIEQALNGEAYTINLTLMGVGPENADAVYLRMENDEIIGGTVRIMIQPCDENDQALGDREVMFTGRIDNVIIDDSVSAARPRSMVRRRSACSVSDPESRRAARPVLRTHRRPRRQDHHLAGLHGLMMYAPRTDLRRLDDWQQRLIVLTNDWRRRPYAYGITDCWQFMLASVEAETGEALMPGVVWPTRLVPVVKFMIANGWESVEEAMDDLLPPMLLDHSQPGDVVSFENGCESHMAIRVGESALTPGLAGLVEFPRSTWRRAWKVG
jgi:hypothetical protein